MTAVRKMQRKIKYGMVIAACFVFLLAGGDRRVQAAEEGKDTSCSITFQLPSAYQRQLQGEQIPIRLYRIADRTAEGKYQNRKGYEELELDKISENTTAQQLEQKAEEVSLFLKADIWEEMPEVLPEREVLLVNNKACAENLEGGLYLVCVKPVRKETVCYQALPYIISLPCLLEIENTEGMVKREWNYDVKVELKLGQEENDTPEKTGASEELIEEEGDAEEVSEQTKVKYRTGDDTNLLLLLVVVIGCGIVFMVLFFWERYVRRKKLV